MRLTDAEAMAEAVLDRWGLDDWTFALDRAKRRGGSCTPATRRITVSRYFVELNDEAAVRDVILHEVAHALAWRDDGEAGHGPAWKRWCGVVGARPEPSIRDGDAVMPPARYRCTVLRKAVSYEMKNRWRSRTWTLRTRRPVGSSFPRHRLSRNLRLAIEHGLLSVFDTKTGREVEA